ncbi:MAG: hypothetical protein JRN57_03870 [Nitrososphaerota archaeon]|nr:hypothetical protein [Nitrososphaerota archaeon]
MFPGARSQPSVVTPWLAIGPEPISTSTITQNGKPFNWGDAPFSGRVNAIAVNGSNSDDVYVGTATGGLWKSTDAGTTWQRLDLGVASPAIGTIVITQDGGTIYVGTGDPEYPNGFGAVGSGVLESTDGGATWSVLGGSTFESVAVSGVLVNPSNPDEMMVSTTASGCCGIGQTSVSPPSNPGIFLSTDGGASWTQLLQGSLGVADMSLVEDSGSGGTSYLPVAGDFQGVLWAYLTPAYTSGGTESTWSGGTWYNLASNNDPNCLAQGNMECRVATSFSPAVPGGVFAVFGTAGGQMAAILECALSTGSCVAMSIPQPATAQGGSTVPPCGTNGQSGYDLFIAVDPANANLMYVACTTLFRSTDGGYSWQPLGGYVQGSQLHPDFHAFALSPDGTVYVGDDGGIWSSTNEGSGWTNLNSGLSTIEFYSIAVSASGEMLGGSQDNGCEMSDYSTGWDNIATGDGGWVGFAPGNPDTVYCLADGEPLVSNDGGSTWNVGNGYTPQLASRCGTALYEPIAQDPNNPGTLYFASYQCLLKTTDYMQDWAVVAEDTDRITALSVAPSDSNTIWLGDAAGGVYESTDGGYNWSNNMLGSGPSAAITSIVVNPSDPNDAVASAATYLQPSIYESRDGSVSQFPTGGLPYSSVDVLDFFGSDFYAGTDSGGVYYLPASGSSAWSPVGQAPTTAPVYSLAYANDHLYVGTYGSGAYVVCMDCVPTTFSYGVSGGTGYSSPDVNFTYAGWAAQAPLTTVPSPYYMDPGSNWQVAQVLPGSDGSQRWTTSGAVSGAAGSSPVALEYYQQYSLQLSLSVAGGGNPSSGTLVAQEFGQQSSASVNFGQSGWWVDAGSTWSLAPVNGTAGERWAATPSSGTLSQETSASATYNHQYYVGLTVAQGSGEVSNATGWYDVGTTVQLGATASIGWAFGAWAGSGTSSYSGNVTSTTLTVGSPISEGADFYPGLTLLSGSSGSVSYSYGSQTGSVAGGKSEVIYVPLGTTVDVAANPSSLFYQFNGWTGLAPGSGGKASVDASAPMDIQANFGYDYATIGGTVAGVAIAAVAVMYLMKRRSALPPPPPGYVAGPPPPPGAAEGSGS